ncbi:peptide-methionine (S)-S-oxide reductase [Candidatus Woesebacteria bacterium RIFCSPHIGHO2_01_FULL_38_9]|uniref:Peptide methionine sulfoxide reductase MsrA n=2 Tax=Candidatus Woeseibacteriota TaxID=1752722 RepID=A0A1F7Y2J5_9BACT|nr:MAG: peptide-methionine (S)-S-oxide reductase [Candidatus Woesebacteria bacterium RIFCSPHIGHO2_01_FULL_38_9]OGM58245.1 MAG: peptide-methionine (S)-S-oxide reductase [Candidatus Woesebacteria bacterium RIFCSPLOWO2_01_FULL_39_10]
MEKATFAGGCFWCTEAIFERLKGVVSVVSGYSGGEKESPKYEDVSSSSTGHAEAIQIEFDPKVISYEDLLYIFFKTHDPTQLNRQGADVGTQYRSVIFYHSDVQRKLAEDTKNLIQKDHESKVVTEILPFNNFFKGEDYHQNYYKENPNAAYCKLVIDPKITKLTKDFKKFLK